MIDEQCSECSECSEISRYGYLRESDCGIALVFACLEHAEPAKGIVIAICAEWGKA